MTDQSLLSDTEQPVTPEASTAKPADQTSEQSSSSDKSLDTILDAIKNEKGERKYKDVQTALEALVHSQEYISQLKAEKDQTASLLTEAQSKLEQSASMTDFMNQLKSSQEQQPQEPSPQAAQGLTAEDVERLLAEREQRSKAAQNIDRVKSVLSQQFGEDANTKINETAQSLGLSVEELTSLAAKSPEAVLKWFGTSQSPKSTGSTLNSAGFSAPKPSDEYAKPTRSLMRGASQKDITEYMKSLRAIAEKRVLGS